MGSAASRQPHTKSNGPGRVPRKSPSFSRRARPSEDVFLCGWSEDDFHRLFLHTQSRRFQAGEVVIGAGEVDRSLYILVDGRLEVLVPSGGPDNLKSVATLETGSVVGEQAFLDELPRSAQVRAVADGEILQLSNDAFQMFAAREPALAHSFLFDLARILSLRLRRSTSAGSRQAQPPAMLVMPNVLPLQRIEIDQEERARQVAEICSSDFFQELQTRCKQMRRSAADTSG